MGFWTAIVAIVAIGTVSEMYRSRLKTGSKAIEEYLKQLTERMARIEERMANLETIVLEREKEREFDGLSR